MGIYTIAFFSSTFIEFFVIERMLGIFYEERRTSLPVMLLSFFAVFIAFGIKHFVFLQHPLTTSRVAVELPLALAAYFLLTLNYKSDLTKRLIVAASIYMLLFAVGVFASVVLVFAFDVNAYYEMEMLYLSGIVHILTLPLAYVVTILFRRFKNIRKSTVFFPTAFLVPVLITLILFYPFFIAFAHSLDLNIHREINIILLSVFMMAATFLTFYLYDTLSAAYESKLKTTLHVQEKESYYAQCQLMQESIEQMKAFKHDIKSQLATLKDYSINGKSEDITNYLNSLIADIDKSDIYSKTGNIAFDSIINYKLRNAKSNGIKPDLRISVPPTLNVEAVDIVTIFGNLLDNALEAATQTSEKIIKLDIAFDKSGLFAKVENSFNGDVQYSEEKDGEEKQILTSKSGEGHGYGLKNIRKSLEKYDGYMKIAHNDNVFSTVVFLYVKKMQEPHVTH